MTQHILLVEDDPAIATSLKVTFKRENWQLTWLDNVGNVLPTLSRIHQETNEEKPALSALILDVGLPDGDGLSLCQSIRKADNIGHIKNLPIIFLTARSDEVDRILGLEMGGDDYCAKPFSPRELVARLKAIWRRQETFDLQLSNSIQNTQNQLNNSKQQLLSADNQVQSFQLSSGYWEYQPQTYRLSWQGQVLDLSNTERNLLLFFLQHSTQVFSREQLLSAISDHPDHRLARTIDSHVKSIRKTLSSVNANLDVIFTHRGIGYGLCKP